MLHSTCLVSRFPIPVLELVDFIEIITTRKYLYLNLQYQIQLQHRLFVVPDFIPNFYSYNRSISCWLEIRIFVFIEFIKSSKSKIL